MCRDRNPKISKLEPNGGEVGCQPSAFPTEPYSSSPGNVVETPNQSQQYSMGSESESKNDKGSNPGAAKRGRKRKNTDLSEAERKHRRMIKNRESAARSRDKRQAYTESLEERVTELQNQNYQLKSTVISVAHAARQLAGATIENEPENGFKNRNPSDDQRWKSWHCPFFWKKKHCCYYYYFICLRPCTAEEST